MSKVCPITVANLSRVNPLYLNNRGDRVNLAEVKLDFPEVESCDLFGRPDAFGEQRGISARQAQRRVVTKTDCSYHMVIINIARPGRRYLLWATCTPSAEAGDIHFAGKAQARAENLWRGGASLVGSGYARTDFPSR